MPAYFATRRLLVKPTFYPVFRFMDCLPARIKIRGSAFYKNLTNFMDKYIQILLYLAGMLKQFIQISINRQDQDALASARAHIGMEAENLATNNLLYKVVK